MEWVVQAQQSCGGVESRTEVLIHEDGQAVAWIHWWGGAGAGGMVDGATFMSATNKGSDLARLKREVENVWHEKAAHQVAAAMERTSQRGKKRWA